MAKNIVFTDTHTLNLEVPSGTTSGDALLVGILPVVALTDRDSDGRATCAVATSTVVEIPVTGALAEGAAVYVTSGGAFTATATDNTLFGANVGGTKGSGSAPTRVYLHSA